MTPHIFFHLLNIKLEIQFHHQDIVMFYFFFRIRTAFIYLSNKGFTKNEPLDDKLPMEQPFILNKSLEMLDKNGRLSFYLASKGITDKFLEKLSGYKRLSIPSNVFNIANYR